MLGASFVLLSNFYTLEIPDSRRVPKQPVRVRRTGSNKWFTYEVRTCALKLTVSRDVSYLVNCTIMPVYCIYRI